MCITHEPKLMSMPTFVKAPSAMALGGVPIGVPKPPKLAAIGMASVKAAGAALSFGRFFKTGAINASIMAAVAVFDMNIEKVPGTSNSPRSTYFGLLPNKCNKALAR